MKKLLLILLLFFQVHGAWANDNEKKDTPSYDDPRTRAIMENDIPSYDPRTRDIMDRILGKKKSLSEEEARKKVDEFSEEKTWWQKQKDKREDKKDAEVTCAHFAGRKANTDKMAKIIYNDCMEQMGY